MPNPNLMRYSNGDAHLPTKYTNFNLAKVTKILLNIPTTLLCNLIVASCRNHTHHDPGWHAQRPSWPWHRHGLLGNHQRTASNASSKTNTTAVVQSKSCMSSIVKAFTHPLLLCTNEMSFEIMRMIYLIVTFLVVLSKNPERKGCEVGMMIVYFRPC